MKQSENIMPAALIAPLSAPIVVAFVMIAFKASNPNMMLGLSVIAATIVSYVIFFLFGLPIVLWLRKRNALRPRNVIAAGIGAGAVLGAMLLFFLRQEEDVSFLLGAWVVSLPSAYGLIVSASFSALAFRSSDSGAT